ncbi:hypothetical protein NT03LS_1794a, partial [Listeria seeligeri FSL N1-067]
IPSIPIIGSISIMFSTVNIRLFVICSSITSSLVKRSESVVLRLFSSTRSTPIRNASSSPQRIKNCLLRVTPV